MRTVFLTVGPQASGKSSFCDKILAHDPTIALVSRDKILRELFGTTQLNPYTGGHPYAAAEMWKVVGELFKTSPEIRLILDAWNGSSLERRALVQKLRELGADRIVAWYFVTPVELVEEWFWQKPDVAKSSEWGNRAGKDLAYYSEDAPRRNHELFHRLALGLGSDGFDRIIRVNPLTTGPEVLSV